MPDRKNYNVTSFLKASLIIMALVLNIPDTSCADDTLSKSQASRISRLFMKKNHRLTQKTADSYAQYIINASSKFKVNPYLIAALIINESTVNAKAVSKGGDYGLMQVRYKVHSKTLKQKYGVKSARGLFDPRINILYGTEILSDCVKRAKGNMARGVLYYSAGNKKLVEKVRKTLKEF